jgi:hypothetical protein
LKQQVGVVEELAQLKPVLLAQVSRLALVPAIRLIAASANVLDWNMLELELELRLGVSECNGRIPK